MSTTTSSSSSSSSSRPGIDPTNYTPDELSAISRYLREQDLEARMHPKTATMPKQLESMPRIRKVGERRAHEIAPQADIEAYMRIVNPQMQLFPPKKQYDDYESRRKAQNERDKQLVDAFRTLYPQASIYELQARISDAAEAYRRFWKGPKYEPTKQEKEAKAQRQFAQREFRRQHPTGIFDDSLQNYIKEKNYVGEQYKEPRYFAEDSRFQNNDQYRKMYGDMFAEMTGVLGMEPKFDPRLLSLESAKKVYNTKDYDVQAYDMDNDPTTPYRVVVRKRLRDRTGKRTGELGPVIAAGGYHLKPASSANELRRLQTMAYYNTFPDKKQRKKKTLANWLKEQDVFEKVQTPKCLQELAKWVRTILDSISYRPPSATGTRYVVLTDILGAKYRNEGAAEENFAAYFGYTGQYARPTSNGTHYVEYRLSNAAYNSLIMNTAKLFAVGFIYPRLKNECQWNGESSVIQKLVTVSYDEGGVFNKVPIDHRQTERQVRQNISLCVKYMVHPSVEAAILNHTVVKTAFFSIMRQLDNGTIPVPQLHNVPSMNPVVSTLLWCYHFAAMTLMNWQYPDTVMKSNLPKGAEASPPIKTMDDFIFRNMLMFVPLDQTNGNQLATRDAEYLRGTGANPDFINMTTKTKKRLLEDLGGTWKYVGTGYARPEKEKEIDEDEADGWEAVTIPETGGTKALAQSWVGDDQDVVMGNRLGYRHRISNPESDFGEFQDSRVESASGNRLEDRRNRLAAKRGFTYAPSYKAGSSAWDFSGALQPATIGDVFAEDSEEEGEGDNPSAITTSSSSSASNLSTTQ